MEAATVVKPTTKQAKVLGLLAQGKTPQQIATSMGISPNGVYGHMRKLKDAGLIGEDNRPASTSTAAPTSNGNGRLPESLAEVRGILANAAKTASARVEQINKRINQIDAEAELLAAEKDGLAEEAAELTKVTANL